MINPSKITNYDATEKELEELLLFWVCAAGKNGHTSAKCLDRMLTEHHAFYQNNTPLNWVLTAHALYDLPQILKYYGIGCYNSKAKSFVEIAVAKHKGELNLRKCTVEDLEKIYGIGRKTARCFIIHSRKDARYAGIDTHILKFLREQGVENVPKATPSSKKEYERLEKEFLKFVDKSNKTVAEFDLEVWNSYAVTPKGL